ncbi:MAG: TetR/AcrR family transcriptional regulator [Sphingomonadaceae bacterium]|nr:TetR/AcrR family transcriptional regulator [Sphingomonadaceae bacterium]
MADGLPDKTIPPVRGEPERLGKGERTRGRLMDLAEDAIIHKGFAATSIEELVEAAGITKSGFFYHFRDKNDLARQLIARFIARDDAINDQLEARARVLSDDELQSFLIFLKLFAETMDDLPELHPGCLVSAITYQDRSFDHEVSRLIEEGVRSWRARFHGWLLKIADRYPPRLPVDLEALADHFNVIVDGSIMTSRALRDPSIIGRQTRLMHDFVRLLFAPN